jgi:hypothetical protein
MPIWRGVCAPCSDADPDTTADPDRPGRCDCTAIGTLTWTRRALARITYLEGFLRVCSFCKKIHAGDQWIPIEEYISDHSAALFSHGLCPQCMKRHYPQYANPPSGKPQK